MARKKTETEKKPHSFFRKNEINSITDIFELYLFVELNQELANGIALECGKFLFEKKGISAELVNYFSLQFKFIKPPDRNYIAVRGNNLLSSLWLIGVYPPNPEYFVEKNTYKNGDFVYKFYTKNKNLVIKPNNNHERKLTSNQ